MSVGEVTNTYSVPLGTEKWTMRRFKKESSLAKRHMNLDQLIEARARAETRLGIMKEAGVFSEQYIRDVEESIGDYDTRIRLREALLSKRGARFVKQAFRTDSHVGG